MKTIQINTGLEGIPISRPELINYFAANKDYRLIAYIITDEGKYNQKQEDTFVAVFEYKFARDSKILQDWEKIATVLNQDCIAVSTDSLDTLAYAHNFKGDRQKFNEEYFIRLKNYQTSII